MSNNPYNTHASAASAYDSNAKQTATDQRELEGRLLMKAANKLQEIMDDWESTSHAELDAVLTYNRKLWTVFVDDIVENKEEKPDDLRNNIANLGMFIFKRTIEILAEPEAQKLNILIEINRDIAAGLLTKPEEESASTSSNTENTDNAMASRENNQLA